MSYSSSYPSRYSGLSSFSPRVQERSAGTRKSFTPIDDEDTYWHAQSEIYPPDGYYNSTKVVRNGKKRSKITTDNREWPEDYLDDHRNYSALKAEHKILKDGYDRRRGSYRETEERNDISRLYGDKSCRFDKYGKMEYDDYDFDKYQYHDFDRFNRSEPHDRSKAKAPIYSSKYHQELLEPSDTLEDTAYRYATARTDTFENYPRINRKPKTDKTHYEATTHAWDYHDEALNNYNYHSYYSNDRDRKRSF